MSNQIALTDLRIGNYIIANKLYSGEEKIIEEITRPSNDSDYILYFKDSPAGEYLNDCNGIPITEELLIKTNIKDIIPEYNNIIISLEEIDNGYVFELDIPRRGFYRISREFKYLHDLQNIVKELFGTELTLNK